MKYSVFCSDLDGTLLSTKSDVSDWTIAEVSRIKSKMKIILVSARMPKSMTYLQKRLGIANEPIICYNGALVLEGKHEISSVVIPMDEIKLIHSVAKVHDIQLGLYHNDEWCVSKTSERVVKEIHHTRATPTYEVTNATIERWETQKIGAHKIMLMGTETATDLIFPKLEALLNTSLHFYRSNATLIEVAPKEVSKHLAIEQLLNNDQTMKDVIAFGDNYNDMVMLEHAGCGVAMGNGRDEVKAIANYTTLKNTENGVAHFIREHL